MEISVVTTKGQVVIPQRIRAKYHIKKGTRICFEPRNGEIVIKPLTPDYFEKMAGILKGGKLTQSLLEERARDKEREEQKIKGER